MARMFLFLNFLEEALAMENLEMRRQSNKIRALSMLYRAEDYEKVYRLSKDLIDQLELELRPLLSGTKRRGKLSIHIRVLCTLSILGNGSYQKIVKVNERRYLSQSSASRCIDEVVGALNDPTIIKRYIRFPQNAQERQILKKRFFEKYKIPEVIGCISSTLVVMKRPNENKEHFYCGKGYHARNVHLVIDADLNILHVDPTYGGATHDSFIFNHSAINDYLEELTNAGEEAILLGDSGYAQRAYLMTPIDNAEENTPEAYYNNLHSIARKSIERTIGLLKGRFRCLLVQRILNYHPDKVAKIITACCVLHNMCNQAGMTAHALTENEMSKETQFVAEVQKSLPKDLPSEADLNLGHLKRQALVEMLWRSRQC